MVEKTRYDKTDPIRSSEANTVNGELLTLHTINVSPGLSYFEDKGPFQRWIDDFGSKFWSPVR